MVDDLPSQEWVPDSNSRVLRMECLGCTAKGVLDLCESLFEYNYISSKSMVEDIFRDVVAMLSTPLDFGQGVGHSAEVEACFANALRCKQLACQILVHLLEWRCASHASPFESVARHQHTHRVCTRSRSKRFGKREGSLS
eukprot:6172256-Pleurochrysis_carterae.AAC.4